jgi:hypothetical protein
MIVVLLALVALATDIGYLFVVQTQAQRCADSAALAGAWALATDEWGNTSPDEIHDQARSAAMQYASLNRVHEGGFELTANWDNVASGDIVIGELENPSDRSEQLSLWDSTQFNTVFVRVRRTNERRNPVPLFFARVMGIRSADVAAEAAAFFDSGHTVGFRATKDTNVLLLPFAVDVNDWLDLINDDDDDGDDDEGSENDQWTYDPETQLVSEGADGKPELNIYPGKQTGNGKKTQIVPGNFGTVDIGPQNNSAKDLRRQIRDGITMDDLSSHGGELRLDALTNKLRLNGDPGLTASIKDAVGDIIGQPRSILLYTDVSGQGSNAEFTIVGFAGIRVVDFSLTGNDKHITVQPALVIDRTAIVESSNSSATSYFVGAPARLVR